MRKESQHQIGTPSHVRTAFAVTAALAVLSAASAASAQAMAPRRLADLLAAAADQSPEVRSAKANSEAAKTNVTAATLQRLPAPTVTLESGGGRGAANVTIFGPVYDFGQGLNGVRLARRRRDLAEARIHQARYDLSLRLLDLYQTYLVGTRRMEAQRRALDLLLELNDMADRRMKAGFATLSETYLVQSRIAQASSEMRGAEAQAQAAKAQIEQIVGGPVDLGQVALDPTAQPAPITDLLARASTDSIPVEIARHDAKVSASDADLARAQRMPVFGVAAERNDYSLVGGQVEYRIVGRVTVAPGAGLSSFARARASAQSATAAEMAVSVVERNVAMAVTAEHKSLLAAQARLPEAVGALEGTREVVDSYRRLFVAGKRSWLDLLNTARELTQAEIAVSDLQALAGVGTVRLRLLAGERLWVTP